MNKLELAIACLNILGNKRTSTPTKLWALHLLVEQADSLEGISVILWALKTIAHMEAV